MKMITSKVSYPGDGWMRIVREQYEEGFERIRVYFLAQNKHHPGERHHRYDSQPDAYRDRLYTDQWIYKKSPEAESVSLHLSYHDIGYGEMSTDDVQHGFTSEGSYLQSTCWRRNGAYHRKTGPAKSRWTMFGNGDTPYLHCHCWYREGVHFTRKDNLPNVIRYRRGGSVYSAYWDLTSHETGIKRTYKVTYTGNGDIRIIGKMPAPLWEPDGPQGINFYAAGDIFCERWVVSNGSWFLVHRDDAPAMIEYERTT